MSGSQNGSHAPAPATAETFSFRRPSPAAPAYAPPAIAHVKPAEEPAELAAPSPARHVDLQRPTRIEPPAVALPEPLSEDPEPLFPSLPTLEEVETDEEHGPGYTNGSGAVRPTYADISTEVRASPPSPYAKPDSVVDETRGKLADLENEMARLLGEITQKRP